jgi:6-phosphogluconolactonase
MKGKPMGRAIAASILSLAGALGVTSCSNDYTVAYVYMTTAKTLPHGLVNAYQIDYQSGYLYTLADSPVDAGGRNTVGLVVAPNNLFLYTINRDDSSIVEFAIGTDGKIYPENTYNISGSFPTAAAIDAQGKFLYVTFTYLNGANGQQLYTPANPGPGGVSIFPINKDNTLGTPTTVALGLNPTGIVTSPDGKYVYMLEQDGTRTTNLLGFSENATSGALAGTTVTGSSTSSNGFASGYAVSSNPTGIIEDSTSSHLYVADSANNQVVPFTITNGVPSRMLNPNNQPIAAPTETGPMGMTFDLSKPGKYLYVVNYTSNTMDTFALGSNGFTLSSSGQPVRSASIQTGTGPTCVSMIGAPSTANPSHGIYMYVSNALTNNVTAEQVNPTDGTLVQIKGSPFGGSTLPSCIVTVPAFPVRG